MTWERKDEGNNKPSAEPQLPWEYGSVNVSESNGYLYISIPFPLRHLAKEMGAKRFDGETKSWVLPIDEFARVVEVTRGFFGEIPTETEVVRSDVPRIADEVAQRAEQDADYLSARYMMSAEAARTVAAYATVKGAMDAWEQAFAPLPQFAEASFEVARAINTLLEMTLPGLPPKPTPEDWAEISDVNSEQVLLGSLLADNRALKGCRFLRQAHFVDPVNGVLYSLIEKTIRRGELADAVTLRPRFDEPGPLADAIAEVGGLNYLVMLLTVAEPRSAAIERARKIRDAYARREVHFACTALKAALDAAPQE